MFQRYISKFQTIPIAWLQLKYQLTQTIAGIIGILCITFLLFIQLGLRNAFLEGALQLPLSFDADIIVISSFSATALQPVPFSSRPLYQALALRDVESVAPLYIASTQWYDKEQSLYRIRVNTLGIPLNVPSINLPGVKENLQKLNKERFSLFDRNARSEFNSIVHRFNTQGESLERIRAGGENSLRELKVVGLFELGVNNAYDATFITNPTTFSQLFNRSETSIDIGLIRLRPGTNSDINIDRIVKTLELYWPRSVRVLSKNELIDQERIFHENNSPVGFIFRFILGIAVVVSIFILYQIMYVKVTNNLGNYATLKALGFRHTTLILIVIEEAIILGVVGYIPGIIVSSLAYNYLAEVTKITIKMNLESLLTVFSLICIICLISGGLSLLKLKDADPVDVFK